MKTLSPMDLGHFYQLGYVTNDMDRAMEYAANNFAVQNFTDHGELPAHLEGGEATIQVGHGMMGDIMFELIRPIGGHHRLYSSYLPDEGFAIRLHHVAYFQDDPVKWDALKKGIEERGIATVSHGGSATSEFIYIDLRKELGHYTEIVHRRGEFAGLDADGERLRVKNAIAHMRAAHAARAAGSPDVEG